jgi:hypothetical protein
MKCDFAKLEIFPFLSADSSLMQDSGKQAPADVSSMRIWNRHFNPIF